MTDRRTASTITDSELDALYEQRDQARRIAVALEQENAQLLAQLTAAATA